MGAILPSKGLAWVGSCLLIRLALARVKEKSELPRHAEIADDSRSGFSEFFPKPTAAVV